MSRLEWRNRINWYRCYCGLICGRFRVDAISLIISGNCVRTMRKENSSRNSAQSILITASAIVERVGSSSITRFFFLKLPLEFRKRAAIYHSAQLHLLLPPQQWQSLLLLDGRRAFVRFHRIFTLSRVGCTARMLCLLTVNPLATFCLNYLLHSTKRNKPKLFPALIAKDTS